MENARTPLFVRYYLSKPTTADLLAGQNSAGRLGNLIRLGIESTTTKLPVMSDTMKPTTADFLNTQANLFPYVWERGAFGGGGRIQLTVLYYVMNHPRLTFSTVCGRFAGSEDERFIDFKKKETLELHASDQKGNTNSL